MNRIALIALLAAGCASAKGEGYAQEGYDFGSIRQVAVVDGNVSKLSPDSRAALGDIFALEMLKRGYSVTERAQIEKAVQEIEFQGGDVTTSEGAKSLGRVLNVDALVLVNVPVLGDEISMTAKMVDVETGSVLWVGSGEGALKTGTSALVGGLTGAAVGVAVGGDHKGTGAIIGGVAGAAVGASFTPGELEQAKEVVKAVCESLPLRG